jgi:hypothetical protein
MSPSSVFSLDVQESSKVHSVKSYPMYEGHCGMLRLRMITFTQFSRCR